MANTFKKVLLLLMICMMVFGNIVNTSVLPGTLIVHAEEDTSEDKKDEVTEGETEEKRPEVGNRDNILKTAGSDGEQRGRILGAMKYNEQMQYLMTYTILKSKYMEMGGYSGIYTRGEFYSGAKKDLEIGIKAGHKNIVTADESDYATPGEKDEADKQDEEKDKDIKAKEKLAKDLTKVMVDDYVREYIFKYFLSDNELVKINGAKHEDKIYVNATIKREGSKKIQDKYFKDFNKGGHYWLIRKSMEDEIYGQLKANNVKEAMDNKHVLSSQVSDEYTASKGYKNKLYENGVTIMDMYSKSGTTYEERVKDIRFYPGKATSEALERAKKAQNQTYDYDKEYAEDHKDWRKKSKSTIEDSKEYKEYEKGMKGYKDDVTEGGNSVASEGVVGLGWLPLIIKVSDESKNKSEYNEFLKLFDGGKVIDKNKVESTSKSGTNTGNRSLQVNDIFNMNVKKDSKGSSASPYLSFNYAEFKNISTGGAYIGQSEYEVAQGISKYAGIKMPKIEKDKLIPWFDKNIKELGIAKALTEEDINDTGAKKLYPHRAISAMATEYKNIESLDKNDDYVLGIDNYGNIVAGSTLAVVIPYWHNTEISHYKDFNTESSYFISTPIINSKQSSKAAPSMNAGSKLGTPKEAGATVSGFSFAPDVSDYNAFLGTVGSYVGDVNKMKEVLEGTDEGVTNTQALALAIVSQTKDKVSLFNKDFIKLADDTNELYIQPSNAGYETSKASDADLFGEYTNKDLLDRIMMILDVGFFELLRLTIAGWVVSFYTGSAKNFQLSSVFHTQLITDTAIWGELLRTISLLMIGFVGVYLVFMTFRVLRKTMSVKDFVRQFIAITMVLVIPTTIYSPLIHKTINEPTRHIVGKQMEQMSLLDAYLEREVNRRDQDARYSKLFGSVEDLRSRTDDYIIDFYTTQHVDGFDVTNIKYEDLSYKNQFRSIALSETGKWRKTDLIKIRVSIFDLFEWVEDKETEKDLFPWLVDNHSKRYGGINEYKEFRTSTAVNYPELGVNYAGDEWTASNLFKKIYQDVNKSGVDENVASLYSITEAFRNRDNSMERAKITDVERERLVTDLALTAEAREVLYGDGKKMSPSSEFLVEKYGGERMSTAGGKAKAPENDFLALENIVNDLVPYRDMTTTSLTKDVYDINKKVIDNYIMHYSIVRETVGDRPEYKLSEFNMIVMDMWFSVNKVLDLPMFPLTYDVSTISFDSYMRMAFIPMDSFVSIEDKDLDNVAQFIALRDHPMTLLFGFLPALVGLLVFGAVYIAVFFVLMMVIMTLSFIWNYIIKNNKENKSWLGALMLIGSFAIAKIGLLILWKAMSYFLNYSYITNGGLTYPYTLIHSLVIIVYLFVVFRFLLLNAVKALWKDKENLGGEIFSNSVRKFTDNMVSRMRGVNPKKNDSSDGSKANKEVDNEGEEGKIKNIVSGLTVSGLKNLVQDKLGYVDSTSEDIMAINEALKATGELPAGQEFYNRFGQAVPGIKGKVGEQLAYDYDSINGNNLGLTPSESSALENAGNIGQILYTTADGSNITAMDAVTEESAERIKNQLDKKGIKATVDGHKVYFNSQGVNLESKEVRKGLFGELIDELLVETSKISEVTETDVEGIKDYEVDSKGNIQVGVGKNGIDTESLMAVVESESFKNSFDIVDMPVIKDGKYLQGKMVVKAKDENVDVEEVMSSMYKVDESMRTIKGLGVREVLSLSKAVTIDEEDEIEQKLLKKHMVEGMKIQNGKVMYDEKNEEHVKSITDIKRNLRTTRDEKQKDSSDTIVRLMSQVTDGGNSGFNMDTVNTEGSVKVKSFAQSSGLVEDKVDTRVFVGKNNKTVANDIEQVRNLINASPKTVESYLDTRDTLYREGEAILMGNDQASDRVLNEMLKFSRKNNVKPGEVNKIEKRYSELGVQRKNSEIKESDYHSEVEGLMSDTQLMLQDTGVYENLMTDTIRTSMSKKQGKNALKNKEEKTKILDRYVTQKKELKEQGVNVKSIEKYQKQDFDKIGQLLGDIENVKVNVDGTVNIKSTTKLEDKDLKDLLNDLTGKNESRFRPEHKKESENGGGKEKEKNNVKKEKSKEKMNTKEGVGKEQREEVVKPFEMPKRDFDDKK